MNDDGGSPEQGTVWLPDTVLLDVAAVRQISEEVLAIADSLSTIGRRLRLSVGAPAPDPYSMRIAAHVTYACSALGVTACDAADELTRMAEIFIGTAQTMTSIARWTSVAVLGIVAPSANRPVDYSRRPIRDPTPSWAQDDPWCPETADEVLSCAVLLTTGDDDVTIPQLPDDAQVETLGARLCTLGDRLRVAWPGGGRPADKLTRFGAWISNDYLAAVQHVRDAVRRWSAEYTSVRTRVDAAAAEYGAARRAALDGENHSVATEAAQAALDTYAGWRLGEWAPSDFPRLADQR